MSKLNEEEITDLAITKSIDFGDKTITFTYGGIVDFACDIESSLLSQEAQKMDLIAKELHYPECWDTMAYPALIDAIYETAAWIKCHEDNCPHRTAESAASAVPGDINDRSN